MKDTIRIDSYTLPDNLIVRAISYKAEGKTWPQIEEIFMLEGYRAKNSLPYHNANIAKQVLADERGAYLRQRVYSKKRRKVKSKAKSKKIIVNSKTKSVKSSTSSQIQFLKAQGFNSDQIVAILQKG